MLETPGKYFGLVMHVPRSVVRLCWLSGTENHTKSRRLNTSKNKTKKKPKIKKTATSARFGMVRSGLRLSVFLCLPLLMCPWGSPHTCIQRYLINLSTMLTFLNNVSNSPTLRMDKLKLVQFVKIIGPMS